MSGGPGSGWLTFLSWSERFDRMEFLQPVSGCAECQERFQAIQALYRVFQAGSTDPRVGGQLRMKLKHYRWHHNERHSSAKSEGK